MAQYSNALRGCQPSLVQQVYDASKSLIHKLIAPTCLLCLEPGQAPSLDLCSECEADLPRTGRGCAICAAPVAGHAIACTACLARRPAFDAVLAPYRYEFPIVELVQAPAHRPRLAAAPVPGTRFASGGDDLRDGRGDQRANVRGPIGACAEQQPIGKRTDGCRVPAEGVRGLGMAYARGDVVRRVGMPAIRG